MTGLEGVHFLQGICVLGVIIFAIVVTLKILPRWLVNLFLDDVQRRGK